MSQGFRAYKERRNPSYNEEVMTCRSFVSEPARPSATQRDVDSEFKVDRYLSLVI